VPGRQAGGGVPILHSHPGHNGEQAAPLAARRWRGTGDGIRSFSLSPKRSKYLRNPGEKNGKHLANTLRAHFALIIRRKKSVIKYLRELFSASIAHLLCIPENCMFMWKPEM